jgi:hypothetical protein
VTVQQMQKKDFNKKGEKTWTDFQRKMVRRSSLVKIWPWWKYHDMYNMYKVW